MHLQKIYVRPTRGGAWRKLGTGFDYDLNVGWWSGDSKTIYFDTGIHVTNQLCALDVASGRIMQLTHEHASVNVSRDDATNTILINYGEKFKIESQGDYFTKGYEDIMAGVDALIAQGIVDGDRMGAMGWSAGGHWSNWILTHTNRFKAISTGAGVMNWISMYAQSDNQRVRQWYMGDKLPYDDYDHWFAQSPLKYIKNAKTPTMIHVVQGDPRVPRPQSEELHMALKRLGVPTEFFVYPGNTHGIPEPRDQYTKAMAEFAWMEHWVRGKDTKFQWQELLKTLDDRSAKPSTPSTEQGLGIRE